MDEQRTIWFVFDAAGVVIAAYTDKADAERLARYFGFNPEEFDGGIDSVELDRPVEEFAVEDEHRV